MMLDLYELVHEKDYFVITSNGEDHFVPAGFSREKVFELEGRMTLFRCGANCCGDTKENKEEILRLAKAEQKGSLSPVLVPRCVKCWRPQRNSKLGRDLKKPHPFAQPKKKNQP